MNGPPPTRADLLELDVEALTVLANTGLVRRAGREVTAGKVPALTVEPDGTVRARFDDGTVTGSRPGQALRDATCTCVASGVCRHRVVLVLAYQATAQGRGRAAGERAADPWSPAGLDLDLLPAKVHTAARQLVTGGVVVRLTGPASAALPMSHVTFLGRDLANARCDCSVGHGCEHLAVAVLAFQQAQKDGLTPPATVWLHADAPADLGGTGLGGAALGDAALNETARGEADLGEDARQVRVDLGRLADQLWWQGSAQPGIGYEAAVSKLRRRIDQLGWAWVGASVERLLEQLAAQRARSSRFDQVQLLVTLAGCTARVDAAAHLARQAAPELPASTVLGVGVSGEVRIARTRLVSLGARVWRSDDADGVEVWLASPDTQAVLVLDRSWPAGGLPVLQRRVAGVPMAQLVGGQVIMTGARRRAGGRVELPRTAQVLPLSPTAWDGLRAPLAGTAPQLVAGLRDGPPAWVRPLEAAGTVRVLQADEVLGWGFDAAAQRLVVDVDSGGEQARVLVPFSSLTPGGVDAAGAALRDGRLRSVAGVAALRGGQLELTATALLTDTRAVVTASASARSVHLPPAPASGAGFSAVEATLDLLAGTLRQGLRHVGVPGRDRLLTQASRLQESGYRRSADLLVEVAGLVGTADEAGAGDLASHLVLLLTAADVQASSGRASDAPPRPP